jgi:uncharacterized protein (DUF885 family)
MADSADDERAEAASFDGAVAAFLEELFTAEPVAATFFGRTDLDDRLPDVTAAGFATRLERARRWLERFEAWPLDALTDTQRVDLSLLRAHLGQEVGTAGYTAWRRYPTLYLENGVFELFMHGTRDEAVATEAAMVRLAAVPEALAAGQANLDPSLMDPRLVREWAIPNAAAQADFMRHGLADFVADGPRRAALTEAGEAAAAAYDGFVAHLERLVERCTGTFACGEEYYDTVLQVGEGFAFGARTLRDMGRAQVESLDAQMTALARDIDGTDDWRALVARLRDDHAGSMEELLDCYRQETDRARAFVRDEGLMGIPADETCAVEPAPLFLRAAAPVASYFPPPYYGPPARGTFNVPFTPDGASAEEREARLRSNSYFEIPGVTAHEAYPGHHLHFAVARQTSALRQVLQSTYMVEGWGLYVEHMVGQHGYYRTPAARLGQLGMRLFRAGRIVVDTSLHLGEMDIETATAFMAERCGFPEPTAYREVLRYCSYPTQASAYLTGALEIERMAAQWTSSGLGTLAGFHEALASSGKLPLGVAAQAIGLAPAPAAHGG